MRVVFKILVILNIILEPYMQKKNYFKQFN